MPILTCIYICTIIVTLGPLCISILVFVYPGSIYMQAWIHKLQDAVLFKELILFNFFLCNRKKYQLLE